VTIVRNVVQHFTKRRALSHGHRVALGLRAPLNMGRTIGSASLAGYDDRTGTHSPSEEWEKRGRYAAEGYQRGVDFGGEGSSSTALARRGGPNIVIHNNPTINVTTGPDVSAEEVAHRLAEISLNDLQAAIDTAAQQVGGL